MGGAAGGKGYLFPFSRKEPRDGGCPQRSTGRRARRQESRGVAITDSRTTFASRPLTKVPAPPWGKGHDDPRLQPADLLRRHTEQKEIIVIPIKTAVAVQRTRIARKSGARQRPPSWRTWGQCLFSKPLCGEVSPHEPGGNDPAYAREKDIRRRQCVENPLDITSDEVKNRPPSGQNCGHRAPKAHRADNERSGCTWVWFHLETNVPKCRRANSGVLIWNRPRNMCQKVTVCRKLTWWNLRRGAKLRGPKTYHRDGNFAPRKAKALVPPWDEVTNWLRRKTKTETICDGDACTRSTGAKCRGGTTNHDGHAPTTLRVAGASAVCAVHCSFFFFAHT